MLFVILFFKKKIKLSRTEHFYRHSLSMHFMFFLFCAGTYVTSRPLTDIRTSTDFNRCHHKRQHSKRTQFLLRTLVWFWICLASHLQIADKRECSCWKSLARGLKTKRASANVCRTWLWMMRNLYWRHPIVKTKPGMVRLCLKLLTINLLSGSLVMRRTQEWLGTGSKSLPQCCKVGKHTLSKTLHTCKRLERSKQMWL